MAESAPRAVIPMQRRPVCTEAGDKFVKAFFSPPADDNAPVIIRLTCLLFVGAPPSYPRNELCGATGMKSVLGRFLAGCRWIQCC